MRDQPWKIVREGATRCTRDRRFRVGARFGMLWVAWDDARCRRAGCYAHPLGCYCAPVWLPGGVAGEAFGSLRALQEALRVHYSREALARAKGGG